MQNNRLLSHGNLVKYRNEKTMRGQTAEKRIGIMVSKRIQKALEGNSAIRAMFNEGREMAAKYGEENVFDFSLGNPATPAPKALNDAIRDLLDEADAKGAAGSLGIHGYMANAGYEEVRQAIAENLNERFGTKFTAHNLVMTVGAAGGLNIIFKTILDPDDEACTSLGVKLGGGLGTAITGWLLAASHFDRALAVQPESCISMLKIMYLVIPFALDAIITFILSRMKVEEANEKLRAAA